MCTGDSGSRRTAPFKVTLPARMSSPASLREQKPSLDNALAKPMFLPVPGIFWGRWGAVDSEGCRTRRLYPPGGAHHISTQRFPVGQLLAKKADNSEGKSEEEEGTTRPSPTASVLEAYHAVPSPSTSRNFVSPRFASSQEKPCHIHTPNIVKAGSICCIIPQMRSRA